MIVIIGKRPQNYIQIYRAEEEKRNKQKIKTLNGKLSK